jgi:NAD-dependent dihydropyrimidine dehydrogenase PreA subunit
VIQDLADAHGVGRPRFRKEREQCVLCGLCVRVCAEQMQARALGFRGRGRARSVGTPFDRRSELCHTCGACLSVCPAADLRVAAPEPEESLQDRCAALPQPCIAQRGAKELHCHLDPCVACEIVRDA